VAFELKGAGIEAARAVFERAAAAIPDPAIVDSTRSLSKHKRIRTCSPLKVLFANDG
jgi:hypothetical protein